MKLDITNIQKLVASMQLEKARLETIKLLKLDSQNLTLNKILSHIYGLMDEYSMALDILIELKRSYPEDFDVVNNLGHYYLKTEQVAASLTMIEKAKTIKPESPAPYQNATEAYILLKDFSKAEIEINRCLEIKERLEDNYLNFIDAIELKIQILIAQKETEKLENFILRYIDQIPSGELIFQLVQINKKLISQSMIDFSHEVLSQKLFASHLVKFQTLIPVYFFFAIYYEKQDKKKSEDYYIKANQEILSIQRYKIIIHQKHTLDRIQKYKDVELFDLGENNVGSNNIFITGLPRSGTTLLESILTANSEVFGAGELRSIDILYQQLLNQDFNKEQSVINLKDLGKKYEENTYAIKGHHLKLVDKMPSNFSYIGFIQKSLPGSKIILLLRNPWDIAISLFKQRYVSNIPYASSFFNIGVYMANFEAIIAFWLSCEDIRNKIKVLKYESLVTDFDNQQKELYEFCGISSSFQHELREKHFAKTASMNQVQNKVHQQSLQKREFEDFKDDFLSAFYSQRDFWISKKIIPEKEKKDVFFGYFK